MVLIKCKNVWRPCRHTHTNSSFSIAMMSRTASQKVIVEMRSENIEIKLECSVIKCSLTLRAKLPIESEKEKIIRS